MSSLISWAKTVRNLVPVSTTDPLPVVMTNAGSVDIGDVTLLAGTAIAGKFGIDQTTPGTTNGVQANAGEAHIGEVGGLIAIVGGTMTRVADNNNYAIGDIIANSVTAASVVPITVAASRAINKSAMIRRIRLKVDDISPWTNAVVRVHFFKDSPTVDTTGDNGAFAGHVTESNHLGYIDVTLDRVFSDYVKGNGIPSVGSEINFTPSTGTVNIFVLLEARTAITTPGSAKTFSLACEVHQN